MTLKECFEALGGNYDEVLGRLRSERLIQKFTLKFLEDGSYDLLCRSMESGDYAEAFRAAHTLKGVCQNLSFTRLYSSSAQLCEALRNGFTPEAPGLFDLTTQDYALTVAAIRDFQASIPQ